MNNFRKTSALATLPVMFLAFSGVAHASAFYLQE